MCEMISSKHLVDVKFTKKSYVKIYKIKSQMVIVTFKSLRKNCKTK